MHAQTRRQTTHTLIMHEVLHNILTIVDKMKLQLLLSLSNHGSSHSLHCCANQVRHMVLNVKKRSSHHEEQLGNNREITEK